MGQTKQYPTDRVEKTERLSRIVLSPKDIDPVTGYPKDSFLSLRQDEEGVSFLRFDFKSAKISRIWRVITFVNSSNHTNYDKLKVELSICHNFTYITNYKQLTNNKSIT